MKNSIASLFRDEQGQDLVEYTLLIAFIALACIIGLQSLGGAINRRTTAFRAVLRALSPSLGARACVASGRALRVLARAVRA